MIKDPRYMIGKLVHDYALGANGIVVSGAWTEHNAAINDPSGRDISWEWLVLYDNGVLEGADTNDLQEIE